MDVEKVRLEHRSACRGRSAGGVYSIVIPVLAGILWALIAVDLTFLLEIDWAPPHGLLASISYGLQVILFWPSAIFALAARAAAVIGWQPGWVGLTLLAIACGGGPGLLVGLALFSWSRR